MSPCRYPSPIRRHTKSPLTWLGSCLLLAAIGCPPSSYQASVERLPHAPALWAEPSRILLSHVERGQTVQLRVLARRSDGGDLSDLQVSAGATWLGATVTPPGNEDSRSLDITIDSATLGAGQHSAELLLSTASGDVMATVVRVTVRVWELKDVHVGPAPDACPHQTADGQSSLACDHEGPSGLDQALAAATPSTHILLHDDDGELFEYDGCVEVPGEVWLSGAPGSVPQLVVISCRSPGAAAPDAVLALAGDHIRLARLTLLNLEGSHKAISTWADEGGASDASRGHLIENVRGLAMNPELIWDNGIGVPFELGPDSVVRNSRFYGYYNAGIDLRGASGSRLVHNTFVFYQQPGAPIDVSGSASLVFANNLVVSPHQQLPALLQASPLTSQLVASGNAVEGYAALVDGLGAAAADALIADNWVGEVEVESPFWPVFLSDTIQHSGRAVPGEGQSLDGFNIEGQREIAPGAMQQRSTYVRPRYDTVRVGNDVSDPDTPCGDEPCDIPARWPNEIQVAVWSAWPGNVIEIYPADAPYAGDAIISWPVTLRGMSDLDAEPSVVLQSEEEDSKAEEWGLWQRHQSLLAVLDDVAGAPVAIENLVLRVDDSTQASATAITIEGSGESSPPARHQLSRLRIEASQASTAVDQAMMLGDNVLVQDVLIHGPFGACIRYGPQHDAGTPLPAEPVTRGWVLNLTCRLTGVDAAAARAGFEVDWVDGTLFADLVMQLSPPGSSATNPPYLFASPRAAPTRLSAHAITLQGEGGLCSGFDCSSTPDFELADIDVLATGATLFVSATDSHIDPAAAANAIDSGIDYSQIDSSLTPGRSLDGVDRAGRSLDRGAFEQGL